MPTQEQLESRQKLAAFLQSVAKPVRAMGARIKSDWFGRPDDELKGWIERGRAIAEIQDSMGYKLIASQVDKEVTWAQQHLEICAKEDVDQLRCYLKALRFLKDFILTIEKNADIATSVLAGREAAIGRDSQAFVKNARVEN